MSISYRIKIQIRYTYGKVKRMSQGEYHQLPTNAEVNCKLRGRPRTKPERTAEQLASDLIRKEKRAKKNEERKERLEREYAMAKLPMDPKAWKAAGYTWEQFMKFYPEDWEDFYSEGGGCLRCGLSIHPMEDYCAECEIVRGVCAQLHDLATDLRASRIGGVVYARRILDCIISLNPGKGFISFDEDVHSNNGS